MAYQVPPRFSHGQFPTAADLNKLSNAIASLNARLGREHWAADELSGNARIGNVYRWLWYSTAAGSGAEIVDPAGVNDSVSLADTEGEMAVYDLSSVSWLSPGRVYKIVGAKYAIEDSNP